MTIVVHRKLIPDAHKFRDRMLHRAKTAGRVVFNPDDRRRQAALCRTDRLVRRVWNELQQGGMLTSMHTLGTAVVLYSEAGCMAQPWHLDYDPRTCDADPKPMGILLALQDDTPFLTPVRSYMLDAGDVLCFDGDEVHAGAAFETENVRVHIHSDLLGAKPIRNTTWLIE